MDMNNPVDWKTLYKLTYECSRAQELHNQRLLKGTEAEKKVSECYNAAVFIIGYFFGYILSFGLQNRTLKEYVGFCLLAWVFFWVGRLIYVMRREKKKYNEPVTLPSDFPPYIDSYEDIVRVNTMYGHKLVELKETPIGFVSFRKDR